MILLISDTPVAGTVDRLAKWIGQLSGVETRALVKRNYPHHAFPVTDGTFDCIPNWVDYIGKLAENASLIIFHNTLDEGVMNTIMHRKKQNASVLYQIHSPPFEGPQFTYSILDKYNFDSILSVNQGHGRFVKNTIPVPNIIEDYNLPIELEKHPIVFIPHIRSTKFRWSNKFSDLDLNTLKSAKDLFPNITLSSVKDHFGREVVSHSEIKFLIKSSAFVVDDINTGLVHQTAFEGLKAGCGVFSGADLFTLEEYTDSIDAPLPPFINVSNAKEIVKFLISNSAHDFITHKSKTILEYSNAYLGEERLAKCYMAKIAKFL